MEVEVKWDEIRKMLLSFGFNANQVYAIREEFIGNEGVLRTDKLMERLEEFGLKHAEITAFFSNFKISEEDVHNSIIKLAGTYVQYDLSEKEGVRKVQMFINDAIANGVITLPQSAESMEGTRRLDVHRQGLFLEVNGELNEATLTGIKEAQKLMSKNKSVWFIYKKQGIMAATDNYAPNTFIQLAEKLPTKKLFVVALEFHKLSDVVAGTAEPVSLRVYIKKPESKPVINYPFNDEFRGVPLIDSTGRPLIWNTLSKYGLVPYPYRKTKEEQEVIKSGPNFIPGRHHAVDYNFDRFGNKVPGFAPFAGYVLKLYRKADDDKNGGAIVIRGFVQSKKRPGLYDEITLTIHHLDKIDEKIKVGDFINVEKFIGYSHTIPNVGTYFCMKTEINGEPVPITKIVEDKRVFVPLKDLEKIPKEMFNPELKEIAVKQPQKLLR